MMEVTDRTGDPSDAPLPDAPRVRPGGIGSTTRLTRTLVLVGLMGAGKTSVGKRLAHLLGVPFTDSDNEIVTAAGMSIPEIFATFGEDEFRDGERRVISRLLSETPRILATGGGAFIQPQTREAIVSGATSVWIRASVDLLWDRVRDRPGRPLLATADPYATLSDLHRQRSPTYALADITVDSRPGASHDTMAWTIIDAVLGYDAANPHLPPALETR